MMPFTIDYKTTKKSVHKISSFHLFNDNYKGWQPTIYLQTHKKIIGPNVVLFRHNNHCDVYFGLILTLINSI